MRFTLEEKTLTLYFVGELNSYNADGKEKEIEDTLKNESFNKLILNFGELKYISSAGLRIVLKLKQKYNDVSIVDASLEVYDVLSMTGFTNMMEIKKALKQVDITGAQIVGEGFFSTVYRIDKDTIIKVFNRTSDPQQIERELSLAKQAFVLGIPTAISFDIVKVKDKLGVRFEMLDCISLKNAYLQYPERFDELTDKYVALLNKITSTECFNPEIPKIKDFYKRKVEFLKDYLDEKYYLKAKKIIENIPERMTFVHGDCHFKNIMVQGDDFLLIDMDTLSTGHPIFEIAGLYCPYIAFEEDDPGNNEKFLGVPTALVTKLFKALVKGFVGNEEQSTIDKIALVAYIHMLYWNRTNEPQNNKRFEGCKGRLIALLDKYEDVEINK